MGYIGGPQNPNIPITFDPSTSNGTSKYLLWNPNNIHPKNPWDVIFGVKTATCFEALKSGCQHHGGSGVSIGLRVQDS